MKPSKCAKFETVDIKQALQLLICPKTSQLRQMTLY